jgi:hypothetical protein
MLIALSTAVVLAGVRLVKRGPTLVRVAALAGLSATTVLTHTRGVAVVPSAVIALAIALWVHRPGWRRAFGQAALLAGGLALGGIIYLTSTSSVSAVVPGAAKAAPFSAPQFASYVWQFYLPKLPFMDTKLGPAYGFQQAVIESFFGQFASLEVRFPQRAYQLLQAWWLVAAAWIAVLAIVRRRVVRANLPVLLLLAGTVVSLLALLHGAAYNGMLSTPTDPVFAGRYLLPVAPIGACAVAYALSSLPRRVFPAAAGLVVGGFLVLSLAGLGLTFARFYA